MRLALHLCLLFLCIAFPLSNCARRARGHDAGLWETLDQLRTQIESAVVEQGGGSDVLLDSGLYNSVASLLFSSNLAYDFDHALPILNDDEDGSTGMDALRVTYSMQIRVASTREGRQPALRDRDLGDILNTMSLSEKVHAVRAEELPTSEAMLLHDLEHCPTSERITSKSKLESPVSRISERRAGDTLIKEKVLYRTEQVDALSATLIDAITTHLHDAKGLIPHEVVSDVLSRHLSQSSTIRGAFVFYVLNLDLGREYDDVEYLYIQQECGNSFFLLPENRGAWIDLRAGPVSFGPKTSGDGVVDTMTVPYSLPYIKERRDSYDLVELASFIIRSSRTLLMPSMDHLPNLLPLNRAPPVLRVYLYLLHDHPLDPQHRDELTLDWWSSEMQNTLQPLLHVDHLQRIEYKSTEISIYKNFPVASAVANSLREYSSTALDENNEKVVIRTQTYLDSQELYYWFARNMRAFPHWKSDDPALENDEDDEDEEAVTIPVMLLHMSDRNMLLLDRKHQVVAFPDMVIAVHNAQSSIRTDFACSESPSGVNVNGRNLGTRLAAGVLQTAFGVLPSSQHYLHSRKQLVTDYTWALSSPFDSYLRGSAHLPIPYVDLANRNRLINMMNDTISRVLYPVAVLRSLYDDMDIFDATEDEVYEELVVRWSMLEYKLHRAATLISFRDWQSAYQYIRSAYFDTEVMDKLLDQTVDGILSFLVCKRVETWPLARVLNVVAAVSTAVVLIVVAGLFLNSRILQLVRGRENSSRKRM